MTLDATFVINGCERVIVSQIIRSPGVYFEKNKSQRPKNLFKRKFSTDINKLRVFAPSGEAFISEFDLFFSYPSSLYDPIKKKKKIIPHWQNNSIYYYSIKYLNNKILNPTFYFLQCFKFYRIICKLINYADKNQFILLFLKWLKVRNNFLNLKKNYFQKMNLLSKTFRDLIPVGFFVSTWIQKINRFL